MILSSLLALHLLFGGTDPLELALSRIQHPEIIQTLNCESGLKHHLADGTIITGKAGEIGIAQFLPSTWDWMTKSRGVDLDINNPLAQLNMIEWAFDNGLAYHWTCYNQFYGTNF